MVPTNDYGTDLTINSGNWYSALRWGPASARSTTWANVAFPVYDRMNSEVNDWFAAVGQVGATIFSPAVEAKCAWGDSWASIAVTAKNYSNSFPATSWNIPDYDGGDVITYDGILPGINLNGGSTLSDTHNTGGLECNPTDARLSNIQLWVGGPPSAIADKDGAYGLTN